MNLLLLTLVLSAQPVAYVPAANAVAIDADTVSADIVLTEDIRLVNQHIRASNYDAWESRRNRNSKPFDTFTNAQWLIETSKGAKAKGELIDLLATGELFVVLTGRDVYGRLLGELYVYQKRDDKLVNVAEWMREKGHARK